MEDFLSPINEVGFLKQSITIQKADGGFIINYNELNPNYVKPASPEDYDPYNQKYNYKTAVVTDLVQAIDKAKEIFA